LGETGSEQIITDSFLMERFNLRNLNKVVGKGQFLVEVSNSFVALKILYAEVYITNGAKETIRENITISTKRVQVIMN
jgi:hypothetical protein